MGGLINYECDCKFGGTSTGIGVSQPWFDYIADGSKTIEGRLAKGKFAGLRVGDMVTWLNGSREVKTKIVSLNRYSSFREYLTHESLSRCLPGISTIEKGVDVYYQYYTPEDESRYGVLAIELQRMS